MSESYGATTPSGVGTNDESGSLQTAKHEASDLKDTAKNEAGHVAETAKGEAKAVAAEVKYQAKDLYAQTQRELSDQARVQQQRLASGLHSVSRELDSMTANAENPGVATDLLRQGSQRLSSAGTWLSDRDPSSVLAEVKSFARRKPGTFIIGAAILGIVAGRLTRALASNASEQRQNANNGMGTPASANRSGLVTSYPQQPATPPTVEETPLYAQSSAGLGIDPRREDVGDVRSDSF